MNPDQQTERLLEDWLDDEARPMPQHVLEAALEAVSRTTQVGRKGRFAVPWLDQRVLAVGMAAAVFVLAVIAAPFIAENLDGLFGPQPGGGPDGSPGEAQVWDPAADFRGSPNQLNPSPDRYGNPDVWSYLRSASDAHDPAGYSALPDFEVVNGNAMLWYERDLFSLLIGHRREEPTIWFHPWSDGNRANNHHAVLGWRSPVTGIVTLSGRVEHTEPTCIVGLTDGTTFSIDHEGTTLRTIVVTPGEREAFEVTALVASGEALYFVVDPGRASNCDNTSLQLTITHEK